MDETKPASRLASADILKVIAILAVVFIHGSSTLSFSPSNLDFDNSQVNLFSQGFRFCVPAFIFLWAYFMEKSFLKRGKSNVITRFYKLLIPFLFWSMAYFLITADFKNLGFTTIITKYWSGFGWSGQYYFIILFQLILLFPFLRVVSIRLIRFIPAIYILSIIFFIFLSYSGWFHNTTIAKISHRPFFYWLPYTVLGIIAAHRNIFRFVIPLPLRILSIILVPLEIFYLHPQTVSPYILTSVFISTMIIVSSIESRSFSKMREWQYNTIRNIAGMTLGIFCLNPLVIITLSPAFKKIGFPLQFPGCSIILPLLSTFLVTSICILVILLLKRIKLGFLVST